VPRVEELIALLVCKIPQGVRLEGSPFEDRPRHIDARHAAGHHRATVLVCIEQPRDPLGHVAAPLRIRDLVEPVEEPQHAPLLRERAQVITRERAVSIRLLASDVIEERVSNRRAPVLGVEAPQLDAHRHNVFRAALDALTRHT
jgi:hypothetical protein